MLVQRAAFIIVVIIIIKDFMSTYKKLEQQTLQLKTIIKTQHCHKFPSFSWVLSLWLVVSRVCHVAVRGCLRYK